MHANQSLTLFSSTGSPFPAFFNSFSNQATNRLLEFFTAQIRNKNTRHAYMTAAKQFFKWCDERSLTLKTITPIHVATYIETHPSSAPTVKQHLAALKVLFDYLVTGSVITHNPVSSVKGPKYKVKKGKTPVLESTDARLLLDSMDTTTISGKRDKALIGLMVFSFARVSAVINMQVSDYYALGKRWWIRLHEKGGKFHEVPVHHTAENYLDDYIQHAHLNTDQRLPLFRSINVHRTLTANPMNRNDVLRMIKRRCKKIGLSTKINCHSFRATGITTYLKNGGTLEHAQHIAAHESPKTTKLYDRTSDAISLDEIEKIVI